ncbi:MAG: cystathionine beta-lyase [Chlamydiales bacterium]|jgi:cystathionine beta-lyase
MRGSSSFFMKIFLGSLLTFPVLVKGAQPMEFATKAIHVGQRPDPTTGAVIPPVYLTSTYVQEEPGKTLGYDYTRAGNPNFSNLEEMLASLEGGKYATVFSSGLGAITSLLSTMSQGDHVLALNGLYGGTYRLFSKVFEPFGIKHVLVSNNDWRALEEAMAQKPKMIIFETPTNPLLDIVDIQRVGQLAKKYDVLTVVDNTFATPYFQSPLELGADVVVHSTTKYIGGHSDVIGGVVISNSEEIKKKMDFQRMAMGLNPSPFDTWLTARGVKTLAVRMERHEKNARELAIFFTEHPMVKKVYFPGLESNPDYALVKRQMHGFGGIVSVEFELSLDETKRLISSFNLFALAESLGGVESLVDHPASMTHASIPKEEREKSGLLDGLVRFSVGIEDISDLIQDVEQGMANVLTSKAETS